MHLLDVVSGDGTLSVVLEQFESVLHIHPRSQGGTHEVPRIRIRGDED